MSTEETWTLALDGVECRICGHTIKLQHAASDPLGPGAWRGYAQDLQLAAQQPVPHVPQALVPAALCESTFHRESRTMHAACWKIVESLWGKSEFTMAELDGFLDVSSDLAPFLPEMPSTVSPLEINADPRSPQNNTPPPTLDAGRHFFTTLEDEGLQKPLLPDLRNHALPSDLDRHVQRWLTTTEQDDEESQADPTLSYWSSVTRMLENHPQFINLPPGQAAAGITPILRNLADRGLDAFPHLANYDIVHANAVSILLTLLQLPLEDITGEPDQNGQRARLQTNKPVNLPPALDTPACLRLRFSTLRRQSYAEGGSGDHRKNNLRVGMRYLRDIWLGPPGADIDVKPEDVVVGVPSFAGLRFVRDHVAVCAVFVKQGDTWRSCWQQDPEVPWQEGMEGTESTVVEWQPGVGEPSFLIACNTYQQLMVLEGIANQKKPSTRKKLKKLFKLF